MAYINNTFKPQSSASRFTRPFTPALNNVRFTPSKTPTSSSKLDSSTLGMNTFNISQPSQGWKDALKGKTVPGVAPLMGPVQANAKPTSPASSGLMTTSTPTSTKTSTATPVQTNPQPEVGTTTTVGTVPAGDQTRMLKSDRDAQAKAQRGTGTSFGGTVRGLIDRSKTSRDQERLLKKLETEAQANKPIGEQARSLSEDYGKQIAEVGRLGAGAVAGNLSTGSNLVGSGNAAIASQSASQRMQALGQAQSAALQGTGQQLTSQSQLTSALTSGLGAQQAQQSAGITGLGVAGQLSQPNPAAYGQTVFDPTTGQYTNNNMDPQTQASNLAQQVMSGAMTYEQALASIGYAGAAGSNFLNNAITGAGGNPLQLQASGTAQQSNIATAGTAATDIARAGLGAVTPQYVQTEANVTAAKEQAGRALSILQETGLNNVSSTDFNKAANELRSRMGDPNFAAFQTAINEAKNFYTSVLAGSGSTPSGNEEIAGNIAALNTNSPISAIVASLKELEFASSTRLQSLSTQQGQYNANLGGGGYSGGGGGFAEAW